MLLNVKNLSVSIEGKIVIHDLFLRVAAGEIHVIMGPNGSGKSTFAMALMGNPSYKIEKGTITLEEKKLNSLKPHERAKRGLFLGFQSPVAVSGLPLDSFLRTAKLSHQKNHSASLIRIQNQLEKNSQKIGLNKEFLSRSINDGFSGGERKKAEVLQLLTLKPKLAILDEVDTGLDVDALKKIAEILEGEVKMGMGLILITHYQRILNQIKPDYVHLLRAGEIVKSGDYKLAAQIDSKGYEAAII